MPLNILSFVQISWYTLFKGILLLSSNQKSQFFRCTFPHSTTVKTLYVFLCAIRMSAVPRWWSAASPAQSLLIGAIKSEENSNFHTLCLTCVWMKVLSLSPSLSCCCLSRVIGASWPGLPLSLFLRNTHTRLHKTSVIWRRGTREMNYERLENERRLLLISTR